MEHGKIVQIIPAPADMWAWYKEEITDYVFPNKVVCLALVEDAMGHRAVRLMAIGLEDPAADFVDGPGFVGFSFTHMEADRPGD